MTKYMDRKLLLLQTELLRAQTHLLALLVQPEMGDGAPPALGSLIEHSEAVCQQYALALVEDAKAGGQLHGPY